MTTIRVAGTMTVGWQVDLPDKWARRHEEQPGLWDDVAKEAATQALHQRVTIWLMGEDEPPCDVWLEVTTDDVEIEEDDR